ncbi:MAG: sialate O-acetylesterase [Planctomycetes bacterium]|nr:sialate O-acetylesterase [Planctomycetota bacterium]
MIRPLAAFFVPAALFAVATTTPAQAPAPVLRVFLLAGQSNMEGQGAVDLDDARDYNGGRGNLAQFVDAPANAKEWGHLRAKDGTWATRDDVFVSYLTEHGTKKAGPLSVGFAVYDDRRHFGPELGIGHVLGARFSEPVLLVKTAWGGKSLMQDFRPPSATGDTGPFYTRMISEYRAAIAAIGTDFPALARHTPRLDGFVWFQGWNDGCDDKAAAEYERNLVLLIRDLRAELGDPALPFVVGETGNIDNQVLRDAQKNGCAHPDVATGARFVPTRQFLRKAEDSPNTTHGHHWFGNAESYLRIGDALGRAAADLVEARQAAKPTKPR